jgi:hypothetical protein
MRTVLFAALLAVLVPLGAHAADASRPHGNAPPPRTVKSAVHPPVHQARHCTVTHIRMREGTRWVKRTRRSCN